MATKDYLKILLRLDETLPQFPKQLCSVLGEKEFDEYIQNPGPQAKDLAGVIEYLDKALGDQYHASVTFTPAFRKLQRICTSQTLLPPSHTLSSKALNTDEHPFVSGGFSDVYEGTYNGLKVCVKKLRMLYREALMWKRFIHPNIVPFIGATTNPLQIASEWMPGGELTDYINSNPDTDRVALITDVAKGLDYLHSCGVIHGDLKGPNILVDNYDHARITDFGLAQDAVDEVSVAGGQSAQWTAPEVINGGTSSMEADVFSFAMVMVEAFTGAIPFNQRKSLEAVYAVMQGNRPPRPNHPALTDGLWKLMQRCWDQDRHNRPRMSEVSQALGPPILPSTLQRTRPEEPVSNIQQRLEGLNPTAADYRPLLSQLLDHRGLKPHIQGLEESDLEIFVELLDKALSRILETDDLFRKTLRRLQSTCSNRGVLPRSYIIQSEALPKGGTIAAGSFANAHSVELNGEKVCVKTLRSSAQDVTERAFYREVVVWKTLRHPNIVPFLGVPAGVRPPFAIVYACVGNSRITEYVKNNPTADPIDLLWDVADGLHYLHSRNVIHGDLNDANILIDGDGHARLACFGLTSIIQEDNDHQDPNLTNKTTWAAPEILGGGPVSKEGDIFMFAMVAIETFTGHSPSDSGYQASLYNIVAGERPKRPETLRYEGLWENVEKCWDKEPEKRPTTSQLLEFFRTSFPRERGTQKVQLLRSAPSTWTLLGSEDHTDGNIGPRPDPFSQENSDSTSTSLSMMSISQILQRLYSVDKPSSEFLRALYTFIRADENGEYSFNLQQSESTRLVNFMDEALDVIPVTDPLFRRCLRRLRHICSHHNILPLSHIISTGLKTTSEIPIAYGGFADAWEGILGTEKVCVKVLRIRPAHKGDHKNALAPFYREAVVWKRLRHPNVVPFLGIVITQLQLVSEWMPNGTLTEYVNMKPHVDRINLLLDVAEGLNYLHTYHTVHGDLKGVCVIFAKRGGIPSTYLTASKPNILIDGSEHARVCDFGLASIDYGEHIPAWGPRSDKGHTPRWSAPEILSGKCITSKQADIFALGMVVVEVRALAEYHRNEVFTGNVPFHSMTSGAVTCKLMNGDRPSRPYEARELGLTDSVWKMTECLWLQPPDDRLKASEAVDLLREMYAASYNNPPADVISPTKRSAGSDPTFSQTEAVLPPKLLEILQYREPTQKGTPSGATLNNERETANGGPSGGPAGAPVDSPRGSRRRALRRPFQALRKAGERGLSMSRERGGDSELSDAPPKRTNTPKNGPSGWERVQLTMGLVLQNPHHSQPNDTEK